MQSFDQRRNRALLDPYDRRYPRSALFQLLRKLLLYSWAIFLVYLGNAFWNLYLLFRTAPQSIKPQDLITALVLPGLLNNPGSPYWIYGILFLLGMIVLAYLGNKWAKRDIQHEQEVLEERRRDRDVYNVPTVNLNNADFTQLASPPVSQGPPFDLALLPLPEPFIGRTRDVQWLMRRLRASKSGGIGNIAVLNGMAGIGKTGLAAKVVRDLRNEGRFRDGIAVYLCQGQTDASNVLQGVLARFDPQRRTPTFSTLHELNDTVQRFFQGKDALVILDNIEPGLLIQEIVTPLRTAGVHVLLIAQHSLLQSVVPPDASYPVGHLPPHEARELFLRQGDMSRNYSSLPVLGGDIVDTILKTLQYHTLTVKIVGAYASTRDLETLNQEISQDPRFPLGLSTGENLPAVETALTKSISLLPDKVKHFFISLSAFATPEFGRRAALQLVIDLGASRTEARDMVNLLVTRALVEVSSIETLPVEKDRERLRLHPLLRALALSEFERWPMEEERREVYREVYRAVANYYVGYTEDASDEVLAADENNIRGALEWAHNNRQNALVVRLCANMRYFWYRRWRTIACKEYLSWGVAAAAAIAHTTNEPRHHQLAVTLELAYGRVLQQLGEITDANQTLKKNLQTRRDMQDPHGEAEVLASLGLLALQCGHLNEAKQYYDKSRELFHQLRDRKGEGAVLGCLGRIVWRLGRSEEAQIYCRQSLDILREERDQLNLLQALVRVAEIAQDRGQFPQAGALYQEALAIAREISDRQGEGWVYLCLGNLASARQQPNEALDYYQRALMIATEVRDLHSEAWITSKFGEIAQLHGDAGEAEHYYQKSLRMAREVQDRWLESKNLMSLGRLAQAGRQLDSAERYYQEALSLEIAREREDRIYYAELASTFGTFLIVSRGRQRDGCNLLKDAVNIYRELKLPGADAVLRTAQRYECLRQEGD